LTSAEEPASFSIVRGGVERLDDLQPLWESLSAHHAEVAPELTALGPLREPEDSWRVRRAIYEELLAEPGAFVLLAEVGSRPVGYALVHIRGPEETWETGRVAELETLAVLPGERGHGIGTALVAAVFAELRDLGVSHWSVGVIGANAAAIRFYERLDLLPFTVAYIGGVPVD
jgi:GNAT superfamily N-acetyltransferase